MNAKELKALAKHRLAVEDLYEKNGVGKTIKQRLAFWVARDGDYFISHNPTPKQRLAVLEATWLIDQFPRDFTYY